MWGACGFSSMNSIIPRNNRVSWPTKSCDLALLVYFFQLCANRLIPNLQSISGQTNEINSVIDEIEP